MQIFGIISDCDIAKYMKNQRGSKGTKNCREKNQAKAQTQIAIGICDQAVEEPAIGIETIKARPTNKFCNSSELCHKCIKPPRATIKRIGTHILAKNPTSKTAGWRKIPSNSRARMPSPALNKRKESIRAGKLSVTLLPSTNCISPS